MLQLLINFFYFRHFLEIFVLNTCKKNSQRWREKCFQFSFDELGWRKTKWDTERGYSRLLFYHNFTIFAHSVKRLIHAITPVTYSDVIRLSPTFVTGWVNDNLISTVDSDLFLLICINVNHPFIEMEVRGTYNIKYWVFKIS